jgi:hypothetical protein
MYKVITVHKNLKLTSAVLLVPATKVIKYNTYSENIANWQNKP